MGEVQLVATPGRPDEVLGEDKHGPPTPLDGVQDVVHDPLSRKEVPFVETEGQRLQGVTDAEEQGTTL